MKGEPEGTGAYDYIVPWQADVQAVLDQLRHDVFVSGRYHGGNVGASSVDAAFSEAGEGGTRSILDISRVTPEPAPFCAALWSAIELLALVGTSSPTLDDLRINRALRDDVAPGTARFVIVHEGGAPSSIVFIGRSFATSS